MLKIKSTLQWWRLNKMFQTDDKLAYFGLKPNSYKQNNLTTYTNYLPANFPTNDLSIGSTETKYIKLNTKTPNFFCCFNENLTTFLYTLTGAARKQKEKKSFLF